LQGGKRKERAPLRSIKRVRRWLEKGEKGRSPIFRKNDREKKKKGKGKTLEKKFSRKGERLVASKPSRKGKGQSSLLIERGKEKRGTKRETSHTVLKEEGGKDHPGNGKGYKSFLY